MLWKSYQPRQGELDDIVAQYPGWASFLLARIVGDWLPCFSQQQRSRSFDVWFTAPKLPPGIALTAVLEHMSAFAKKISNNDHGIEAEVDSIIALLQTVCSQVITTGLSTLLTNRTVRKLAAGLCLTVHFCLRTFPAAVECQFGLIWCSSLFHCPIVQQIWHKANITFPRCMTQVLQPFLSLSVSASQLLKPEKWHHELCRISLDTVIKCDFAGLECINKACALLLGKIAVAGHGVVIASILRRQPEQQCSMRIVIENLPEVSVVFICEKECPLQSPADVFVLPTRGNYNTIFGARLAWSQWWQLC